MLILKQDGYCIKARRGDKSVYFGLHGCVDTGNQRNQCAFLAKFNVILRELTS